MENRFPLLQGRRILKKESLWDIRDYAYEGWRLYYAGYTDGLLQGCAIRTKEGILTIGRGMIKFHDFVYLIREEEQVSYAPKNGWQVLKAEFTEDTAHPDYKEYRCRFFLDRNVWLEENQIEMCQFYLRDGSVLRDRYKNFSDMATEYDTVNLVHAAVAGTGAGTLHPSLLLQFADNLWEVKEKDSFDIGFCFLIWNTQGMVERRVIEAYLSGKTGKDRAESDLWDRNQHIYEHLDQIIAHMGRVQKKKEYPKMIFVD